MTVQCKQCRKLHVDGEWTEQCAVQRANAFTLCPTCYPKFQQTPCEPLFDVLRHSWNAHLSVK